MSAALVLPASDPSARIFSPSVLLSAGKPAAVPRRIPKIWIDPVDGVVKSRSFAHVFQEVQEVLPPLADLYPSSSVGRVGRVSGVIASSEHGSPALIRRSLGPAVLVGGRVLPGVRGKLRLGLRSMALALHRVLGSGVVARDVLVGTARVFDTRGVSAATTSAQFWFTNRVSHT